MGWCIESLVFFDTIVFTACGLRLRHAETTLKHVENVGPGLSNAVFCSRRYVTVPRVTHKFVNNCVRFMWSSPEAENGNVTIESNISIML